MSMQVTCPYCGATGRLRDDGGNHRILCPRCGMRFDQLTSPVQDSDPPDSESSLPVAVISDIDTRPVGSGSREDFGDPARSGFYESPAIDSDDLSKAGGVSSRQRTLFALKGSRPWGEWLAGVCKASGMTAAMLVETAVTEWAARNGYPDPPPR